MSEELFIHQYKFSDWTPSAIKALAVDPFSGLVAVGRNDGEIELIGPDYKWNTQLRVPGKTEMELNGLAFSQFDSESGRLFGVTMQGYIFEVDFSSSRICNIRDSYGGTVWSIATSTREPILGLGCEDGTAKLFTYSNSQLEYLKSMSSTGSRVLSIAFHPVEPRLYTGCADGTIRCYNETNGANLFRIVGEVMKGSICPVWSLVVLKDSTLISGDNGGKIQFWNGYNGTELISTIHQHASTILCLATNDKEDAIFASGEDSRVICIRRLQPLRDNQSQPTNSSDSKVKAMFDSMLNCQWIYTSSHRPHSHDVRALVIAQQARGSSDSKSILLSGGIDSKLCLYSVDDFTGCRPTWILPIPARGITSATSDSKLLAIKHRTQIDIWNLKHPTLSVLKTERADSDRSLAIDKSSFGPSLACRIQLKDVSRDYFHSLALSNDGNILGATGGGAEESDSLDALAGLRLWHLSSVLQGEIVAEKIPLSADVLEVLTNGTCQSLAFSGNGRSLCVVVSGSNYIKLLLLDIQKPHKKNPQYCVSIRHTINHTRRAKRNQLDENVPLGGLHDALSLNISSLSYSSDGRWLGVCSGDNIAFIYEIDRLALHWTLPLFQSPISCLAFHPQSPNSFIVVLSGDNSFHIFDVQEKALAPWSIENKDIIPTWAASLGRAAIGPVVNISFDPTCISTFVLHGQAFSVYVNLDRPIPLPSSPDSQLHEASAPNSSARRPQRDLVPHLVTSTSLSLPESKLELLQRELNDTLPINRRNIKKRKKLKQMVEEERKANEEVKVNNVPLTPLSKKAKKDSSEEAKVSLAPSSSDARNFSVLKTHRSIVHLSLVNSNEMVVVENPWVRILENLPDTLARKRYGA